MKKLESKKMKNMLQRGIRIAKKIKSPREGHMRSLIYETLKNGWHYQVDYIKDLRTHEKPYVVVYAFKPPKTMLVKLADYYLEQEIDL